MILDKLRRVRDAGVAARAETPDSVLFFVANPEPMWLYDAHTLRFLAVNEAAITHYGYSNEELLRMRVTDIVPQGEVEQLLVEVRSLPDGVQRSKGRHQIRKSGDVIEVEVASHRMRYQGRDAVLVTAHDITEQVALERRLREQVVHDGLTGLPNRALLEDRARQAILRCDGVPGSIAVLIVDLDDFKTVNDIYDRKAGDQILVDVSARLKFATREEDTVARVGGDEFAVLLEDSDRDVIDRTVASIRSQLSDPFVIDGLPVDITCTIGIADTTGCDPGLEALVRGARAAALDAKAIGNGRHQLYEPRLHVATLDRLGLASDLRGVLARGELHLEYQPIVSVPGGEIRGAEALLRWRHPARGSVPPADFIPVAERTGLIVPIGVWVLRTACHEAATWPPHSDLLVSVNVSSRQLREPGFGDDVSRILSETGLDPRRLTLEVTESVMVDDVHATQLRLAQLRSLGVRIALDDFGAGYSSFGYLRSLPLDTVKIDRMFTSSTADPAERRSLVLGVLRLLQSLHVETVAEGIETPAQLEYMSAMGVDRAQGFYFARPMPAGALRELFSMAALMHGELPFGGNSIGQVVHR